jgi:hypothetical protein
MGIKPSDYRTIPVNQDNHLFIHQKGEKEAYKLYEVNTDELILKNLIKYCIEENKSKDAIRALELVIEAYKE